MTTAIIMPKQGQSVESCIITEIRIKKGDRVSQGDILFTYETDKAAFEEESRVEGVVLEVFFAEGDEVPVFTNVLVIGAEGEYADEFRPDESIRKTEKGTVTETLEAAESEIQQAHFTASPGMIAKDEKSAGISPRARTLAEKKGIDPSLLTGSGPRDRVIERDVLAASETTPKLTPLARKVMQEDNSLQALTGTGLAQTITGKDLQKKTTAEDTDFVVKPLTHMRKLIAKAMVESLQNSAQLTHHLGADARRMNELRKKVKKAVEAGYPTDITLNDMICFATIKALKKFPQVNAHLMGDKMKLFNKVNLGLAVDTDRGLMVPVVKNADGLSIQELSDQLKEIAAACRKGNISPELLSSEAASFTVSNLGNYGVEIFTPVINLPQVAILGVNTIVLRPIDPGEGIIIFVPYLGLSLTYDHRAIDGSEATRFVKQVAIEIENLDFDL
jgi:pyruvate dehydrogenase E2 component (dihydrolipoamide acetyltransferase)